MDTAEHDRGVEVVIGTLLRWGVVISAAVVFAGAIGWLAHSGAQPRDYLHFHSEARDLRTISGVLAGAARLSWAHVIQLGLLLLIATPVARVAFTVFAFWGERDWMYVAITLLVLAILLFSLLGGQHSI
ncbi:MAG TPA: DUF1634 domain-containing protein [Bryobacteraceae bacterium]|nr:DUF1634 domain-containing protein [Bryobacteraceae bacterium]